MTDTPKPLTANHIRVLKTLCEKHPQSDLARAIATIEQQREQIEKLQQASSKLTLRLREIENDLSYRGIWPFLYAHNYTYNGPDWHVQLKALEDVLCPPSEALAATEPTNGKI